MASSLGRGRLRAGQWLPLAGARCRRRLRSVRPGRLRAPGPSAATRESRQAVFGGHNLAMRGGSPRCALRVDQAPHRLHGLGGRSADGPGWRRSGHTPLMRQAGVWPAAVSSRLSCFVRPAELWSSAAARIPGTVEARDGGSTAAARSKHGLSSTKASLFALTSVRLQDSAAGRSVSRTCHRNLFVERARGSRV